MNFPSKAELIEAAAYTSLLLVVLRIVWHEIQQFRIAIVAIWTAIPPDVLKTILWVALGIYIGAATHGWIVGSRRGETTGTQIESTKPQQVREGYQADTRREKTGSDTTRAGPCHSKKKQT
jgi:hypothetical protein